VGHPSCPRNRARVAVGSGASPYLSVDRHEAFPGDKAHGNLVSQLLRLQIGVVRENPDVPEFVGNDGSEIVVVQFVEEAIFD
jgi:hypothetical protein